MEQKLLRISVSLNAKNFKVKETEYTATATKGKRLMYKFIRNDEDKKDETRFVKKEDLMVVKSKLNQSPVMISYYTTCLPEDKEKAIAMLTDKVTQTLKEFKGRVDAMHDLLMDSKESNVFTIKNRTFKVLAVPSDLHDYYLNDFGLTGKSYKAATDSQHYIPNICFNNVKSYQMIGKLSDVPEKVFEDIAESFIIEDVRNERRGGTGEKKKVWVNYVDEALTTGMYVAKCSAKGSFISKLQVLQLYPSLENTELLILEKVN